MQPIDRDEVLRIVKFRGPIIPNELKKALKQGDTMLLGAMLSELASKGLVKISNTKLGGSPYYYDPQTSERLERIISVLNEKDQRTVNLLKEHKILRDDTQEALTRVSLRNVKDFCKSFSVEENGEKVLYWRYYLVPEEEAVKQVRGTEPAVQETPEKVEPVKEEKTEHRQEHIQKPERKKEERQEPLGTIEDSFYEDVKKFFDKHNIEIISQELIRKKSEIDFVIKMPTPVGDVEYFCKAKSKKKSNDGDLASAKLLGMNKGLPTVYLTTGEVTKKAKDLLKTSFKGMVVKEL